MPFLRDFFYGLRLFRRNPGFYLLAVLIVSLGIGATTAIFSLIDGVLLNPLPYRDPARLAVVWSDFSRLGGNRRAYTAPALFFDWRERSRSFEGIAAFTATNRTFTALDEPLTPLTHEVTPNFFDVAGVHQSSRRRESFGILARDLCSNRVDLSARLRYRNTIVMPRYFETLRTPILSGRSISDIDAADSLPVAVISQSVAKRYFPKGDPVGQGFRLTGRR